MVLWLNHEWGEVPTEMEHDNLQDNIKIGTRTNKGVGRKISRGWPTKKRLKNSKKDRKITQLSLSGVGQQKKTEK